MITSKDNQIVKHIKSLSQKKYRDEYEEYIVEGLKMSLEAINYSEICYVVVSQEFEKQDEYNTLKKEITKCHLEDKEMIVSDTVFKHISDTTTPQGVLIIAKKKKNISTYSGNIFALDKVQDPGNMGTIIRTLDSAGFKDLIISADCVDVYSPKVVRSTMGAIFRLNLHVIEIPLKDKLLELKDDGYSIAVTSLDTNHSIYDIDFDKNLVVVMGNESNGVSKEIQEISNEKYKIPMLRKSRKFKCCSSN